MKQTQTTQSDVKYPNVTVDWSNIDGNAFFLLGSVTRAMRKADIDKIEIDKFMIEAKSGDYEHLLQTCMEWVNIVYTPVDVDEDIYGE